MMKNSTNIKQQAANPFPSLDITRKRFWYQMAYEMPLPKLETYTGQATSYGTWFTRWGITDHIA